MAITAEDLRPYFRSAWGADTGCPESRAEWTPQNPARDQCGMTALVVRDILGGDLIIGEVQVGGVQGVTTTGTAYRIIRRWTSQWTSFCRMRSVGGKVVARPPDAPYRHREQYELLRGRVLTALAADSRA